MRYLSLDLELKPDFADILAAELGEVGFEAFETTERGVKAYVQAASYDDTATRALLDRYTEQAAIVASRLLEEPDRNWNAEWERDYAPVEVADNCVVRAPFHDLDKAYEYELVIKPEMAFGTGHHPTTLLMLQSLLETEVSGRRVFDVGTGTGALGILARKMGASNVDCCDTDDWSVRSAHANAEANGLWLNVWHGTAAQFGGQAHYHVLLANIFLNVIADEIGHYVRLLRPGGTLLASGFYVKDVERLNQIAAENGLTNVSVREKGDWACVTFVKK